MFLNVFYLKLSFCFQKLLARKSLNLEVSTLRFLATPTKQDSLIMS